MIDISKASTGRRSASWSGLRGIALRLIGRQPSRGVATAKPGPADGCDDGLCDRPEPPDVREIPGRIKANQPLPTLTLRTHDGETFVLPAGGRASILYLMRAASCSICRKHVRALVRLFDQIRDLGVDVVIIQPGSDGASRTLADTLSTPFTIASGRDSGAYAAIGSPAWSLAVSPRCGTLLVDGRGVVRYARVASLPFGAFSESELLDALRLLGNKGLGALAEAPAM